MFLPIGKLLVQRLAGKKVPLPDRVVRVLDRQLRQPRRLVSGKRLVQRSQFLGQHAQRPAIADDVMGIQNQYVIVFRQSEQSCSHERGYRQIKRPVNFFHRESSGLVLAGPFGQISQVHNRQRQAQLGRDELYRLVVDHVKRGAQGLMPPYDFIAGFVPTPRPGDGPSA